MKCVKSDASGSKALLVAEDVLNIIEPLERLMQRAQLLCLPR